MGGYTVFPRLRLQCCKEVEWGKRRSLREVRRRIDLVRLWPLDEVKFFAEVLMKITQCNQAISCPFLRPLKVMLGRKPPVTRGQGSKPCKEVCCGRVESSFARLDQGGDAESPQVGGQL